MRDYNPPDPYSFGNIRQQQDRIERDKKEFKEEELKKELKHENLTIQSKIKFVKK